MKRISIFAGILLLLASLALGQEGGPPVPVKSAWNTTAIPVGEGATLGVAFEVPEKHHITDVEFGLFFVRANDTLGLDFGEAAYPPGVPFGEGEKAYRGRVLVTLPVTAGDSAVPGTYTIPVEVGYQMCQEFGNEICFLPEEQTLTVTATVAARGTAAIAANGDFFKTEPATEAVSASLEDRLIAALNKGSLLAFFLVFVGGILTSFTPCVYPVIPITIGYIGGASRSRAHGIGLAAIFVLGIALVYSTLGLVSAATGSLFGSISGSPIVTFTVAAIFALMGISMLGAFEIALPASMQTKLQGAGPRTGLVAPLVLGMISGLVMAPCVGPVIVALLAWVSQTQNLLLGWSLLFVFSLGLGLLFLVIGAFAGALKALPRAGAWMDGIKHGFGWLLLAAALYLLRLAIPEPYYTLAWAFLLIIFAVFAGAFDAMPEGAGGWRRLWKATTLIVFLIGAISLFRVFGPATTGRMAESGAEVTWLVNEEEQAWQEASAAGKPVLVDVYADWCVACVELDEKTYTVPRVVERVDNFVRLKLDFTKETPWVKEMKQKYKITGMPTVILYDGAGQEVTRFTGFIPADEFVALLDEHEL